MRTFDFLVEYEQGGRVQCLRFRDSCAGPGLVCEVRLEEDRVRLTLEPESSVTLRRVACKTPLAFPPDARVYLNGYQSWTDSRELTRRDAMRGLLGRPGFLVKKYQLRGYGDYDFTEYRRRKGYFHGFGYGYVRTESACTLAGSLCEDTGWTVLYADLPAGTLEARKDCAGRVLTRRWAALDLLFLSGGRDEVLARYFDALQVPAPKGRPVSGYTSWYRHGQDISEQTILRDLESAEGDIFQIDDGFEPFVGDWLTPDPRKFPNGMGPSASAIREKGMTPGIWLAPFACEQKSALWREHPDWLVRDELGQVVSCGSNWSGFGALDIENEAVRAYLKEVFSRLRALGFGFFKLDFLYAACVRPKPGRTRGELMYDAVRLLRECAGDCPILACGAPLFACFGQTEYMRIGCDVTPSWDAGLAMRLAHRERVGTLPSIQNTVWRAHLNGRVFWNDPDVYFLRPDTGLTPDQSRVLLETGFLFGAVHFTSDDRTPETRGQVRRAEALAEAEDIRVTQERGLMEIHWRLHGEPQQLRFRLKDGKIL